MALVLNEEQSMLRDAAAGLLAEQATVAHLRELRDSGDAAGFSPALWSTMVDMGWAGIAIDEAYGGLGYGYTGLGLVLEQVGRNLTASPLESTVLIGATVLAQLGSEEQKASLLPGVASGDRLLTLALQEGNHHQPSRVSTTAHESVDGFILSGQKTLVLDATNAHQLIVIARISADSGEHEGLSAFLVPADAAGVVVERRSWVDSRNVGVVTLKDVQVPADALLGEQGQALDGLSKSLDIIAIGQAAELLGLSLEAFERTIAYLRERKQFGRVIGSFQGLQHRAAEMFAELELARSIVLQALQAIDADAEDLALQASAAKAKLCEVAQRVTNEAIQMHGGIGMTDEHEIGFFIKRARALQHCYGDYNYHLDRFARIRGF